MQFDGLELFERNENLESQKGIDLLFPGDIRIKILRAGGSNKKYDMVLGRLIKPYTRQMKTNTMDKKVSEDLMKELYAESVIIGWSGVKSKGEDVEFNKENVIKLLDSLPEVFDEIREQADNLANFRLEEMKEEAENLGN